MPQGIVDSWGRFSQNDPPPSASPATGEPLLPSAETPQPRRWRTVSVGSWQRSRTPEAISLLLLLVVAAAATGLFLKRRGQVEDPRLPLASQQAEEETPEGPPAAKAPEGPPIADESEAAEGPPAAKAPEVPPIAEESEAPEGPPAAKAPEGPPVAEESEAREGPPADVEGEEEEAPWGPPAADKERAPLGPPVAVEEEASEGPPAAVEEEAPEVSPVIPKADEKEEEEEIEEELTAEDLFAEAQDALWASYEQTINTVFQATFARGAAGGMAPGFLEGDRAALSAFQSFAASVSDFVPGEKMETDDLRRQRQWNVFKMQMAYFSNLECRRLLQLREQRLRGPGDIRETAAKENLMELFMLRLDAVETWDAYAEKLGLYVDPAGDRAVVELLRAYRAHYVAALRELEEDAAKQLYPASEVSDYIAADRGHPEPELQQPEQQREEQRQQQQQQEQQQQEEQQEQQQQEEQQVQQQQEQLQHEQQQQEQQEEE
ncbi:hypothetical protein Efla_001162 [Eimeria flavescens]